MKSSGGGGGGGGPAAAPIDAVESKNLLRLQLSQEFYFICLFVYLFSQSCVWNIGDAAPGCAGFQEETDRSR